jgi:lactate dehydrogenase-like 2-hydroxyacid dehydrogenase
MFSIVYPDARFADQGEIERAMLAGSGDVELCIFPEQPDGVCAAAMKRVAQCDALVVYHKIMVDNILLDYAPRCRLVVRAGVGLNTIDLKACAARGVAVCNVPDYGTHEVADHTIALMLALMRGTSAYHARLRAEPLRGWHYDRVAPVRRIFGSVMGIAGLGRIGTAVAERAVGFGMRIIHSGGKNHDGFERVGSIEDLLRRSDVLSLHLPLTDETRCIIDAAAVTMMKRGLILINTARGQLIDSAAVCEGLRSGQLAAVGLDVLPAEPPNLTDPLISAWQTGEEWIRDRIVITPHAAFFSEAGFTDLRQRSLSIALSFLRDGELRNCVNQQELKARPRGFDASV